MSWQLWPSMYASAGSFPLGEGGLADLVHHSDRGAQYLSMRYTDRLADAGIEPSVGSRGDSYDNVRCSVHDVCGFGDKGQTR